MTTGTINQKEKNKKAVQEQWEKDVYAYLRQAEDFLKLIQHKAIRGIVVGELQENVVKIERDKSWIYNHIPLDKPTSENSSILNEAFDSLHQTLDILLIKLFSELIKRREEKSQQVVDIKQKIFYGVDKNKIKVGSKKNASDVVHELATHASSKNTSLIDLCLPSVKEHIKLVESATKLLKEVSIIQEIFLDLIKAKDRLVQLKENYEHLKSQFSADHPLLKAHMVFISRCDKFLASVEEDLTKKIHGSMEYVPLVLTKEEKKLADARKELLKESKIYEEVLAVFIGELQEEPRENGTLVSVYQTNFPNENLTNQIELESFLRNQIGKLIKTFNEKMAALISKVEFTYSPSKRISTAYKQIRKIFPLKVLGTITDSSKEKILQKILSKSPKESLALYKKIIRVLTKVATIVDEEIAELTRENFSLAASSVPVNMLSDYSDTETIATLRPKLQTCVDNLISAQSKNPQTMAIVREYLAQSRALLAEDAALSNADLVSRFRELIDDGNALQRILAEEISTKKMELSSNGHAVGELKNKATETQVEESLQVIAALKEELFSASIDNEEATTIFNHIKPVAGKPDVLQQTTTLSTSPAATELPNVAPIIASPEIFSDARVKLVEEPDIFTSEVSSETSVYISPSSGGADLFAPSVSGNEERAIVASDTVKVGADGIFIATQEDSATSFSTITPVSFASHSLFDEKQSKEDTHLNSLLFSSDEVKTPLGKITPPVAHPLIAEDKVAAEPLAKKTNHDDFSGQPAASTLSTESINDLFSDSFVSRSARLSTENRTSIIEDRKQVAEKKVAADIEAILTAAFSDKSLNINSSNSETVEGSTSAQHEVKPLFKTSAAEPIKTVVIEGDNLSTENEVAAIDVTQTTIVSSGSEETKTMPSDEISTVPQVDVSSINVKESTEDNFDWRSLPDVETPPNNGSQINPNEIDVNRLPDVPNITVENCPASDNELRIKQPLETVTYVMPVPKTGGEQFYLETSLSYYFRTSLLFFEKSGGRFA